MEITRQSIDQLIADRQYNQAFAGLRHLFRESPHLGNAQFVLSRVPQIESIPAAVPYRLAVLRSFTIEPVLPLLRASALLQGIDLTVQVGEFNTYAQDMLDPGSALYRFDPHAVILAVQTRDLVPDIWGRFVELSPEEVDQILDRTLKDLGHWFEALRSRTQAHLILHNLEVPTTPANGILDGQGASGQVATILRLNDALRRLAGQYPGVYVLDYDGLVAGYGRERWHDERKWLTMRMPLASDALSQLAGAYLRFLVPLSGRVCKALVVDLDNTLWGGVIGEEGLYGIQIGPEHPGAAFLNLQRAILDLAQRGILLAICSKNNPEDALEVFQKRSEMLLKPEHFAALRINWQDKAQNLREIAAELNIGIDSLAFLDDNPVERQRVQDELPEVTVIDLPADPMLYATALRACPRFERLSMTSEDRQRNRYYAEQRQRTELQENAGTLEDFLRSLQMEAEIAPVSAASQARIAQLTQKTNQFNLTTRRYSEQQISEMGQSACWHVAGIRVRDRFGDNGLVGVGILRLQAEVCEIDVFLLSCRVIGRSVETAFLAYLASEAAKQGAAKLQGWFLPTQKNAPSREFYPTHGFHLVEEQSHGTLWELDLAQSQIACPDWIVCSMEKE